MCASCRHPSGTTGWATPEPAAHERASVTWADFLRSQADALLACDFIKTVTLGGQRRYIRAVIEHATRRVRVLRTTAHPTAAWVVQAMRNLVMDLEGAGCRTRYLIRDRDGIDLGGVLHEYSHAA